MDVFAAIFVCEYIRCRPYTSEYPHYSALPWRCWNVATPPTSRDIQQTNTVARITPVKSLIMVQPN